jgi:hypothetical protein
MKKIILFMVLISLSLMAKGPSYKLLIGETLPKEFDAKIIKKTTIILTEARLYLQKKYKKTVSFEYTPIMTHKKSDIKKLLNETGARWYVATNLKVGKCKKKGVNNVCKGKYIITLYDGFKNMKKKIVKIKAKIIDNQVVAISAGEKKNKTKTLAKILKKKAKK